MLFVKSKLSNYLAHTFISKSGILRLNSHQQQTGWGGCGGVECCMILLVLCQLCNYQAEEHDVQIRPQPRYLDQWGASPGHTQVLVNIITARKKHWSYREVFKYINTSQSDNLLIEI